MIFRITTGAKFLVTVGTYDVPPTSLAPLDELGNSLVIGYRFHPRMIASSQPQADSRRDHDL